MNNKNKKKLLVILPLLIASLVYMYPLLRFPSSTRTDTGYQYLACGNDGLSVLIPVVYESYTSGINCRTLTLNQLRPLHMSTGGLRF